MTTQKRLAQINATLPGRAYRYDALSRRERDSRAMHTALEAALELHQPIDHGPHNGFSGEPFTECQACTRSWPCPTVTAITEALGGAS